jgi:hypothetical protein
MNMFNNKILLFCAAVCAIVGLFLAFRPSPGTVSPEKLVAWIKNGYSQQFCRAIYPHLAKCITLKKENCVYVASTQVDTCIATTHVKLPDSSSPEQAKEIYASLEQCFQTQIHSELTKNYLINTPECVQMMS